MQNEHYTPPGGEFTQIVSKEAEQVYADFRGDYPEISGVEQPWDSPYCFDIVQRLRLRLAERGIMTNIMGGGGHRHGIDDTHEFLETEDEIVICPTWQQIIPEHVKRAFPDLPHVLVTPRNRLEEILTFYQVPHIMQLLLNVPEKPDAPWGLDEQAPPQVEEHDAVLAAIRQLINTMRPPQH